MKDISKLSAYLDKFTDQVIENVVKAQSETAKNIQEDAKSVFSGTEYAESIQVSDTEVKDNTISTEIFTDKTVDTKSGNVYNLGFLLETGTDPHAIPNAFGWGDIYGYESEMYKRTLDPDWHPGTISQPHFKPALEKNVNTYLENIRKAVKEAEK